MTSDSPTAQAAAALPAPPVVFSDALIARFAQLAAAIPAGRQFGATWGASTTGIEAGLSWRPVIRMPADLTLTAYAGRLWSAGWVAGTQGSLFF